MTSRPETGVDVRATDAPSTRPEAGTGADATASDATVPPTHECVLVGADVDFATSTTWVWNGSSWTERTPAVAPKSRWGAAAASLDGKVVLFSGDTDASIASKYANDTWTWDGVSWTELSPVQSPPGRDSAVAATLNGKVILFGGAGNAGVLGDTWEWDGTTWTELHPAQSPPARWGAAGAVLNGKLVVFGGITGLAWPDAPLMNDTWEWDGTTWTERSPSRSPSPRNGAALATLGNTVVLFGGLTAGATTLADAGDTWTWDGTAWTQLEPATSPPARAYAAAGSAAGEVVVAGGLGIPGDLDDTWAWNGSSWMQIPVPGPSEDDLDEGAMTCL